MLRIDENTGLPELPNGYTWSVREVSLYLPNYDDDELESMPYARLLLYRNESVERTRRVPVVVKSFFGLIKRATYMDDTYTEVIRMMEHSVNLGKYGKPETVTKEGIAEAAIDAYEAWLEGMAEAALELIEQQRVKSLFGDYPPNSVA